jgi:adenylate cyclase class 2
MLAGARLVVSERLIEDRHFDTPDLTLRRTGRTVRVRRDGRQAFLTFKGPVLSGPVKSREEIETSIGDAALGDAILNGMGLQVFFVGQKYREDYELGPARLTIDRTPMGVFVEIEAVPDTIERVARLLGRSVGDYRLESYPALWRRYCTDTGQPAGHMVFDTGPAR